MTLDKGIEHGKEHRKPYRGSKRFDKKCRNHGLCSWCKGNRTHAAKVSKIDEDEKMDVRGDHERLKTRSVVCSECGSTALLRYMMSVMDRDGNPVWICNDCLNNYDGAPGDEDD